MSGIDADVLKWIKRIAFGCRKCRIVLAFLVIFCAPACTAPDPAAGEAIPAPQGQVLFSDDFSDPQSGWETWSENGSMVIYQDGGLRILVNQPQYDYWSRPGKRYADTRLEVDAVKLAGPDNNDYGLICRHKDRDNYYAFLIGSDGYAGVLKVYQGVYTLLNHQTLEFQAAVNQGPAMNHLRAECIGSTLSMYINEQKVFEVQDQDMIEGEVGVIAGAYDQPGVDVIFDNFAILQP
ncbi:MAG: hypothetical protein VB089_17790 [Anaerolineaceae bacterium]|nr:hypothetical protein [Anaerolineaceae bacterium]